MKTNYEKFIKKNACEYVVCKMLAILFRPQTMVNHYELETRIYYNELFNQKKNFPW